MSLFRVEFIVCGSEQKTKDFRWKLSCSVTEAGGMFILHSSIGQTPTYSNHPLTVHWRDKSIVHQWKNGFIQMLSVKSDYVLVRERVVGSQGRGQNINWTREFESFKLDLKVVDKDLGLSEVSYFGTLAHGANPSVGYTHDQIDHIALSRKVYKPLMKFLSEIDTTSEDVEQKLAA